MLAGPSECLVIAGRRLPLSADETASPELVAADLLAQAEHDVDARAILISIQDSGLVEAVDQQLRAQLKV